MNKLFFGLKKIGIAEAVIFFSMAAVIAGLGWRQFESNRVKLVLEKELAECRAAAPQGILSPNEAAKIAVDHINNVLLTNGKTAVSDYDASEVSGIYEFKITVEGKDYDTYVTKDGKIVFAQAHKVASPDDSQNK